MGGEMLNFQCSIFNDQGETLGWGFFLVAGLSLSELDLRKGFNSFLSLLFVIATKSNKKG
jgi:hypothetical protein